MDYEHILYERTGAVVQITLNRPESRNALQQQSHLELGAAFARFYDDPDARVAILTGAGEKAFCAGNDLKATAARHSGLGGPAPARATSPPFGGITAEISRPKPIIAAVNGAALGGGFELVLACDLAVSAEHATFGLPEPRWGLIAAAGGLHRLPRQVPLKQAMAIILTGQPISAAQALALGLLNEVVPAAELMAAAQRMAALILAGSPVSIEVSLRAVGDGLDLPLAEAMAGDRDRIALLKEFEDFYEGPRSFAQRRQPHWSGRLAGHAVDAEGDRAP